MRNLRLRAKKLGVVRKYRMRIPETMRNFPTIITIPLDIRGKPLIKKLEIHERKKLHKGFHTKHVVLLIDDRDNLIQREIIS